MLKNKFLIVFISMMVFSAWGYCASEEQSGGPVAFSPEPVYEFEPVLDGESVSHDYIIQNKGTAVLNVEHIRTG
jgi:hypothetical protein